MSQTATRTEPIPTPVEELTEMAMVDLMDDPHVTDPIDLMVLDDELAVVENVEPIGVSAVLVGFLNIGSYMFPTGYRVPVVGTFDPATEI